MGWADGLEADAKEAVVTLERELRLRGGISLGSRLEKGSREG